MQIERKQKIVRLGVRFFLFVQLLMLAYGTLHAQSASSVLQQAAKAYETSEGIKADFTLQARSEQNHTTESFEGVIQMKGDKFKLQTPDMVTWYDGKVQWTYLDRTEEVNISEPDGAELQFTNPMVLLRSYEKGFTATLKGSSTTRQGKTAYDVLLTPKKKSEIVSVSLQIEKNTGFPASLEIESKNGVRHILVINNWNTHVNQPDALFVFDEKAYPDAEIVDLR